MKIAYRMCCPSHASKCIPKSHNSNGRVPRISKINILLVGLTLISHDVTAISGTHADPRTSWTSPFLHPRAPLVVVFDNPIDFRHIGQRKFDNSTCQRRMGCSGHRITQNEQNAPASRNETTTMIQPTKPYAMWSVQEKKISFEYLWGISKPCLITV